MHKKLLENHWILEGQENTEALPTEALPTVGPGAEPQLDNTGCASLPTQGHRTESRKEESQTSGEDMTVIEPRGMTDTGTLVSNPVRGYGIQGRTPTPSLCN